MDGIIIVGCGGFGRECLSLGLTIALIRIEIIEPPQIKEIKPIDFKQLIPIKYTKQKDYYIEPRGKRKQSKLWDKKKYINC